MRQPHLRIAQFEQLVAQSFIPLTCFFGSWLVRRIFLSVSISLFSRRASGYVHRIEGNDSSDIRYDRDVVLDFFELFLQLAHAIRQLASRAISVP